MIVNHFGFLLGPSHILLGRYQMPIQGKLVHFVLALCLLMQLDPRVYQILNMFKFMFMFFLQNHADRLEMSKFIIKLYGIFGKEEMFQIKITKKF